jgi:hypothetical protein
MIRRFGVQAGKRIVADAITAKTGTNFSLDKTGCARRCAERLCLSVWQQYCFAAMPQVLAA